VVVRNEAREQTQPPGTRKKPTQQHTLLAAKATGLRGTVGQVLGGTKNVEELEPEAAGEPGPKGAAVKVSANKVAGNRNGVANREAMQLPRKWVNGTLMCVFLVCVLVTFRQI
jgi:hypothetical protein